MWRMAVSILLACALGTGLDTHRTSDSSASGALLPQAPQPGVTVGADAFVKRRVFADERIDRVTDIRLGELDPAPGREICVAGNRGASFLTPDYRAFAFVDFKKGVYPLTDYEIVDVESDGACEFAVAASWATPPALLDHGGRTLWVAKPHDGTDDSVAVDLDGDGVLELVVAYNGSSGVRLLDRHGRERWKKPGSNVWAVGAADVDGDGVPEILSSAESGGLDVRNPRGEVVGRIKPQVGGELFEFTLVPFPSASDPQCILKSADDAYLLFDLHGKLVASLAGPYLDDVKATPVRFDAGGASYFALVGLMEYQGRRSVGFEAVHTVLLVYDERGKLVYQEVSPVQDSGLAIRAVPAPDGRGEVLLVGGRGTVWEYRPSR